VPHTRLFLVRHGEQDPGTDDAGGLSALGREQAERLGRRLRAAAVPFDAVHVSSSARAVQTAGIVGGHLPQVPRHLCDFVKDRTPVPSAGHRDDYPARWHDWLDGVPATERDEEATALRGAVTHFGVVGDRDRHELLITHNFVIGWFVRHVLDAPQWRWIGLNQANCALTVVEWSSGRPPVLVAFNDTGHL
jgi:serine/threonine-protein phosphatase PGAM5